MSLESRRGGRRKNEVVKHHQGAFVVKVGFRDGDRGVVGRCLVVYTPFRSIAT